MPNIRSLWKRLAQAGWNKRSETDSSIIEETRGDRQTRWTRNALLYFMISGLTAEVLFSIGRNRKSEITEVFGYLLLVACAAFGIGALAGFLFGVPRTVSASGQKPQSPADEAGSTNTDTEYAYKVNTNLEDISDWLTKIIVGIGLVQIGKLPSYATRLSLTLTLHSDQSIGWAAVMVGIFFVCCGLFWGYLFTRLFLTRAFKDADAERAERENRFRRLISVSPPSGKSGQVTEEQRATAQQVQALASTIPSETVRAQMVRLISQYDTLVPIDRGKKTQSALDLVNKMRSLAFADYDELHGFAYGNSEGRHVAAIAFLQMRPNPEYLSWLVDIIENRTPFPAFCACVALLDATKALKFQSGDELLDAIERAYKSLVRQELAADSNRMRTIREARMILGLS